MLPMLRDAMRIGTRKFSQWMFMAMMMGLLALPGYAQTEHYEPDTTEQSLLARSRSAANELLSTLKRVLIKQLEANGPVRAMYVCADTAQVIAGKLQMSTNISVRRISEKWRNPLDTPDGYESARLRMFAEMHASGALRDTTEVWGTIRDDSVWVFRYMRPIFIQAPCLACHGDRGAMKEVINAVLQERYPRDRAIGYKPGDLRGAVSVKIRLP